MTRVAKYVQLTARPEREAELLTRLAAVQQAAAEEPGTDIWILHTVPGQPNTYAMYEIYRDEQASAEHEQLPALRELLPELNDMLVEPFTLVALEEKL